MTTITSQQRLILRAALRARLASSPDVGVFFTSGPGSENHSECRELVDIGLMRLYSAGERGFVFILTPEGEAAAYGTPISVQQREILRHALGLDYDETPTRNHFNAEPGTRDCEDCEALVDQGLMVKLTPIDWIPGDVFRVTDRGRQIALEEPSDA